MSVEIGDRVYHTIREDYCVREHFVDESTIESANWNLSVEGSPIHDNRAEAEDELQRYIAGEIEKYEQIRLETDLHLEFLKEKVR